MKPLALLMVLSAYVAWIATTSPDETPRPDTLDLRLLYDAIRQVETGGHPNPDMAVGDGGKSHGAYQIGEPHYRDSVEYDRSLRGITFADAVRSERTSELLMRAYWDRYVPRSDWSYESLARTHNGGPQGRFKSSTDRYWERCEKILNSTRRAK